MASIASGANATGTFGYQDSITIQTTGSARFECPTGTVVAEFRGSRTFGPYDSKSYTITSLQGAVYYEVADGTRTGAAVVAADDGSIYSSGRRLYDASSGHISGGTPICDWQASTGTLTLVSANSGESVSLDSSKLCDGLPMLKCVSGAAASTFIANFVFSTPITLAQMQSLQIPFQTTSNQAAFVGTSNCLQIWFNDDTTPTRQWQLGASTESLTANTMRPEVTHTLSFAPGSASQGWSFGGTSAPTNTTDMDAVTIARLRIVFVSGGTGETVWVGPIRANGRTKPVVSLTIDGSYTSAHQYILPMFEAQGLRASLALQWNQVGTGGRMSWAQLDRAYAWGHEIIHHTYDGSKGNGYQDSGQWANQAAIEADINAGLAAGAARGYVNGAGYAVHGGSVHPFTTPVAKARQQLVAAAYRNCGIKAIRTGNVPAPLERLSNFARPANIDPYNVHGGRQVSTGSTDTASSLAAFTTRAKNRGEACIFTFHRSVISGPSSLELLNSELQTFAAALGADVRAGLVECLPFGEMCSKYTISAA